jgi:hypothetical protein
MHSQSSESMDWRCCARGGIDWVLGKRHCEVLVAESVLGFSEVVWKIKISKVSQDLYEQWNRQPKVARSSK